MGCSNSTSGWKKKTSIFCGVFFHIQGWDRTPQNFGGFQYVSKDWCFRYTLQETNITWGKGKSSSNMPYQGDMLVSWRVCLRGPNTFSRGIWMSSKPSNFLCRIPLKFMTPSSGLGGTNLTSLNLRLGTVSFWEKFVPQGKTTHGKNKTLEKWSPKKKKQVTSQSYQ